MPGGWLQVLWARMDCILFNSLSEFIRLKALRKRLHKNPYFTKKYAVVHVLTYYHLELPLISVSHIWNLLIFSFCKPPLVMFISTFMAIYTFYTLQFLSCYWSWSERCLETRRWTCILFFFCSFLSMPTILLFWHVSSFFWYSRIFVF